MCFENELAPPDLALAAGILSKIGINSTNDFLLLLVLALFHRRRSYGILPASDLGLPHRSRTWHLLVLDHLVNIEGRWKFMELLCPCAWE